MKNSTLKTRRLLLTPMTDEELEARILRTEAPDLKAAYGEMLDGCRNDAANRLWYTAWKITLRDSGEAIGDLCFKGPAKNAAVEIGYGIDEPQRLKGYATEAAKVLIDWAFFQNGVYFVEAETEPDNLASQKVLKKLDFQPDGEGEEGPRFVLEKPISPWGASFMCLGLGIGMALGSALGSIGIGLSLGICVGLCLGVALDGAERKKREGLRRNRKK